MKLPRKNIRLVFGFLVITAAAALAYLAGSMLMTIRASFPQRPLIAAALPFLERGITPQLVLPGEVVEVTEGGTWMTVTDREGRVLASTARANGGPVSLDSCRTAGEPIVDCFLVPSDTMPRRLTLDLAGTRQAVLVAPWAAPQSAGYVFAGRTRDRIDERWRVAARSIGAIWLVGLGAFAIANRSRKR